MRRVLVTGGGGFIGGYIVDELIASGIEPLVLDHAPRKGKIRSDVDVMLGDVRDATIVTEAAAHVDGIIHLAAVLGTQETIKNPRPSAETNILGSLNVFEAANQYSLPVVYAGVGNHWMREHGGGSYTISKTAVEDYAKMYNKFRDGRISVVRPVNAYGPKQSVAEPYGYSKVRKIIPSFAARALHGDPIEIYGSGEQISDCVYVADVARVFAAALLWQERNEPDNFAFEVGPIEHLTVNDVAEIVRSAAARHSLKQSEIVHLPMRPGEVPDAVVTSDISTLRRLGIDAEEFVPFSDGARRTVDWFASWFETHE